MPNHTSLASLFSDIADAIRAKTGDNNQIVAGDFPAEISGITTGLTFASLVTATRSGNLVITASNLAAEPKFFVLFADGSNFSITSTGNSRSALVIFDGTNLKGYCLRWEKGSGTYWESYTTYSKAWNSTTNTLTITAPSGKQFPATGTYLKYKLLYAY